MTRSDLLGATLCVLLAVSVIAYSRPSTQETRQKRIVATSERNPETGSLEHEQEPANVRPSAADSKTAASGSPVAESSTPVNSTEAPKLEFTDAPSQPYMATAYCLRGVTASGRPAGKGLIAADPSVLPLGTRVRVEAGPLSGEYLVADTGGGVKGHRIDIWTPTTSEAIRFGNRPVKLTVLSYGPRRVRSEKQRKSASQTHGTRSENSSPPGTKTPF